MEDEEDPSILFIDLDKLKDVLMNEPKNSPSPVPVVETGSKRSFMDIEIKSKKKIQNLDDLIEVLEQNIHRRSKRRKTNKKTDNEIIRNLLESLKELKGMVGLDKIKTQIVNQILLFTQNLNDNGMFLHTVLTGNPGVGKTNLCKILAKIYKNIGFLKTDNIVFADRAQLIGQYLGETSIKTKSVLDSAKGGILLIDEAYSLGNKSDGDSFSKECIDTINQYLSEHVDELICIIAGYEEDIESCFFSKNRGLERRFPWRYKMDNYNSQELYQILKKQIQRDGWNTDVDEEFLVSMLDTNKKLFKNNGGDTQIFLDKCKILHAQRVFGTKTKTKKTLTKDDFDEGLKVYKDLKTKKIISQPPKGLYI